jgi:hypothetical protein
MCQKQGNSKKAEAYTFGVEIESWAPLALFNDGPEALRIGLYHCGTKIPQGAKGFPCSGWELQRDGSLKEGPAGYWSFELVSPILKGRDGIEQLKKIGAWLKSVGARPNQSCGTHVHVGAASVIGDNRPNRLAGWAANLINVIGQYELALFGSAGTIKRYTSTYCQPTRKAGTYRCTAEKVQKARAKAHELSSAVHDRYMALNLVPLQSKGTVEFRVFSGTVEPLKLCAWVQLCLALAERAAGRRMGFDPKASTCYRGTGKAMKDLDRFFYLAGWTLGRKDHGKEEVAALGWLDDLDALETVKKELRRLASKFDAEWAATYPASTTA